MVAVSEGFALGTKLGIDPKKMQEIFTVSTSKCWCTDATNPVPGVVETAPSSKGYQGGFGTGLIRKDLTLDRAGATLSVAVQISPLRGSSDEHLGTLVMVEDLTELMRAQRVAAGRGSIRCFPFWRNACSHS